MKKILTLLLITAMLLTLFACQTSPNQSDPAADSGGANNIASPVPEETGGALAVSEDTGDTASPAPEETGEASPAPDDDDDLAYIMGNGELIIGFTDYAPMNYYDETGALIGFDTEFAEALCEKLGVTPKFVEINWDTKEFELKAKNIDCIWNGLTVTEERRENMAFSSSYLRNEQSVVVRASEADKYTSLESLQDALLVAEDKSAGASAIEADLPGVAFTPVISQAMALLEVKAGTADAAVIDFTMARAMTGEGTDYSDLILVSTIKMMPEEYAIGLRPGSSAVARFDEIIAELTAGGTLSALAEKYGVADLLIR